MKRPKTVLTNDYLKIVREISKNIRMSRYLAARSVNRESLLLYFRTGKLLSVRIASADWGDAVLEMISQGIQGNFPGIRGFSISNLKNMRQFYEAYAHDAFSQLSTGQINKPVKSQLQTGQTAKSAFVQFQLPKLTMAKISPASKCFFKSVLPITSCCSKNART